MPCSARQPRGQGGSGAQLCGEEQAVLARNRADCQGPPSGEGGGPSVVLQPAAAGETGQDEPQPQRLLDQTQPQLHSTDEQGTQVNDVVDGSGRERVFTDGDPSIVKMEKFTLTERPNNNKTNCPVTGCSHT